MPISWNLSQVENLGYTKLSEWNNKELGRFKVEVPPHLHNDGTGGQLLRKWMLRHSSWSSRGAFSVPQVLAQLRGACRQSAGLLFAGKQARTPTEPLPLTVLTVFQCCQQLMSSSQEAAALGEPGLSAAWHELLAFQPRTSGQVTWELGNYLDIIKTEEVIQENSNRQWKGSHRRSWIRENVFARCVIFN